ncbi:CV_2116 domain-containing protein [Aliamphritea hakodatensis]|uniref:CV_2116 domain-containing protein n=1 Tax=Aliamphritea hakodatensis TaxID=2895352 RepID=UPI0035E405D6
MIRAQHKGFLIFAAPEELTESRKWSVRVLIQRNLKTASVSRQQYFKSKNTCDSREEAEAHCIFYALRVIDGKIPGQNTNRLFSVI